MESIASFLWLMPVLFMVHEFEEIFMIEAWYTRHKDRIRQVWPKRMPFGLDYAGQYHTASIGIGIFSEYLFVILVCLLCAIVGNYYAWYGLFAAIVLHFLILHLRDIVAFRGYTPGIVTGAVVFIPSVWMLVHTATILHYGVLEVLLSTVAMHFLLGSLVFRNLHKAMASWSERLYKYSQGDTAK